MPAGLVEDSRKTVLGMPAHKHTNTENRKSKHTRATVGLCLFFALFSDGKVNLARMLLLAYLKSF